MELKILASRYELLERIGSGGMAEVYKGKDKMLNRFVAIKILREEFKENEDFIRRFKVESQAAACLSHQNIVQIYDVGEEDGIHFIVMELLEGLTLKQYINSKDGHLSRKEAVNFSMQICRALEHAHSKHVVHRDIKPQNIVITENGKLKVADFGIARAANNSTTVNSGAAAAVGSAHYLSPEQARGGYTDQRSDIYSLGVVMYEMFTGSLPFDAEESVGVVMQHLHEQPLNPRDINPSLPPGIESIILRAMCKEQRLRYESATQILEDLILVYQNASIDVSLLNAAAIDEIPAARRNPPQKLSRTAKASKENKSPYSKLLIGAGILVVAAFFTIVGFLFNFLFAQSGREVEIPTLTGLTYEEAAHLAQSQSTDDVIFEVFVERSEHSNAAKNTIISQIPEGGSKVKRSREIKVVISLGPSVHEMEDYTGKKLKDIEKLLKKYGLKVIVEETDSDTYDEGVIVRQIPLEGTRMAEGDEVTLYVSVGTKNTVVPDVLSLTLEEAIVKIERNDLKIGTVKNEPSTKYPKGQICYQSKSPFETVPINTEIDLYVSSGSTDDGNVSNNQEGSSENPEKAIKLKLTNLPKDREKVNVRLVLDGQTYYEKDFATSSGSITVSINTNKTLSLDVYYDGVYITTKEVKY